MSNLAHYKNLLSRIRTHAGTTTRTRRTAAPVLALAFAALTLGPLLVFGAAADPITRARAAVVAKDPQALAKVMALLAAAKTPADKAGLLGVLGNLKPGSVGVEGLEPYLADPDALVRSEAVQVLGKMGGEGVSEKLAEVLKNDPNEGVRLTASLWLGQDEKGAEALGEALESDKDANVRASAARGLKAIGPKGRAQLNRGSQDKHPAVKKALKAK